MKSKTLTVNLPHPPPIYLKQYVDYTRWDADVDTFHLWHMWQMVVADAPHKPAIIFNDTTYTYEDLDAEIHKMAQRLTKLGLGKNSHIGIFMTNSPWYVISYYAIFSIGGVVVNYNPLYVEWELHHQIADSNSVAMITLDVKMFTDKLVPLLDTTPLQTIVACPNDTGISQVQISDTVHTFTSLGDDLPPIPTVDLDIDDLAVLQYTGGTTGVSKGAMLTHLNLSANMSQLMHWKIPETEAGYEKRVATFLPLFHIYSMSVCMNLTILYRGCMIMAPRFQLDEAMDLVEKHSVTVFPCVPTMYQAMSQMPIDKRQKMASVCSFTSGGAPLLEESKKLFESQFNVTVIEGYGLSETSPVVSENPRRGDTLAASIGFPLPQTDISLRNLEDPDCPVANGVWGEICIKGPQVTQGYWNNPTANAKAFTTDGYFRTGDVGVFNENGWCSVVDRIKDIIICGGYNVYPRRIENAVMAHPAVVNVIVIGIPDPYRGERPKAFVCFQSGLENPPTEQDIIDFTKDVLSPIERLKDVEIRDDLPKTHVGKLSKKHLREELEGK